MTTWYYRKLEKLLIPAGEIPDHTKNIIPGPHVVMPNHVHGILILKGNQVPFNFVSHGPFVETRHALSLPSGPPAEPVKPEPDQDPDQPQKTIGQMRFQNPGKNTISTIIGGYKSAVSKDAHKLKSDFEWQMRFHDYIIRDEEEYSRIVDYIINNPAKWKEDKFYRV